MKKLLLALGVSIGLAGCVSKIEPSSGECWNEDGALDNAGFVIVENLSPGNRVSPGFIVTGCSRTFEAHVPWALYDRTGWLIAMGFTHGGGFDGYAPFQFVVRYDVDESQWGELVVWEEDVSGGEGFRPFTNTIPLYLRDE